MGKNVRKITSGTKEWAEHTINCISGCANDCRYCYAKVIAKRFGRKTDENWKEMEIRKKDVEKNYGRYNGRVMFPSSHDIINEPHVREACFSVIGKLLDSGNELLITTKPDLSVVKDIMEDFHRYRDNIQFRFTITSKNDDLLSFWEPNAPCFDERLESLILTYKEGFRTSVSVEPFLDEDPSTLVGKLEPYTTGTIWIGSMNYIKRTGIPVDEQYQYNRIRRILEKENLSNIYKKLNTRPKIRFKDSIKIKLGINK
jgi:DNA repair photolyase